MRKNQQGTTKADTWGIFATAHLLAEFNVDWFAIAANAVEHPRLDAAPTHSVGTQLTCAPVWRGTKNVHIKVLAGYVHKIGNIRASERL